MAEKTEKNPRGAGRPTLYEEPLKSVFISLRNDQIAAIKKMPGSASAVIRDAVDAWLKRAARKAAKK